MRSERAYLPKPRKIIFATSATRRLSPPGRSGLAQRPAPCYSKAVRIALLAAAAAALVASAAVAAAPLPKPGTTLLGVSGPSPEQFDALTGKHHALHLLFARFERGVTEL